jgi:hypothetical protein
MNHSHDTIHWPDILKRAAEEEGSYLIGITKGMTVAFRRAEPTARGEWVRLIRPRRLEVLKDNRPALYMFTLADSPLEVPLAAIDWVIRDSGMEDW